MFKNASHAPSFKVIVSCSEGLHRRGPKQNHYIPGLVKISSQEAKGPISLSANIADMCIPSQIICDSDPKILDVFDIFEDRSLQSI